MIETLEDPLTRDMSAAALDKAQQNAKEEQSHETTTKQEDGRDGAQADDRASQNSEERKVPKSKRTKPYIIHRDAHSIVMAGYG